MEGISNDVCSNKLSFSWKKLTYSVTSFGRTKTLLTDIWGTVHSGETLAIMGPSGSGKTTLLNLLADQVSSGKIEGEILVNGKPRDKTFNGQASYVCQENRFMEVFSVRETIEFHSILSQPSLTNSERDNLVNQILVDLGLVSCQDTVIGNWMIRGISSGQMKRLALALALISKSGIILMDEPTSKVDSSGALHVVKAIKTQAEEKSKTILFSIHQPSSEIFALFDKLLLLSRGQTAFFGSATDAQSFFEEQGNKFAKFTNPADKMLLLVNPDFRGEEVVQTSLDYYETSQSREALIASVEGEEPNVDYKSVPPEKASFFRQFILQTSRLFQYVMRNQQQFPSLFMTLLILPLGYSALFFNYDKKSEIPIPVLMADLCFLLVNCVNMLMVTGMQHVDSLIPTFHRERSNGKVDCLPFCLAMFVVHVPFDVSMSFVIALVEYLLVGLNNVLWFGAFYAGTMAAFGSIFRNIYLITSNQTLMISIYLIIIFTQMFASGFVITTSQMKFPFKQLNHVSVFKYTFEGIAYNELEGETDTPQRNATAYLESYGYSNEGRYEIMYIVGAFTVTFQITYFLLLFLRHDGKK